MEILLLLLSFRWHMESLAVSVYSAGIVHLVSTWFLLSYKQRQNPKELALMTQ